MTSHASLLHLHLSSFLAHPSPLSIPSHPIPPWPRIHIALPVLVSSGERLNGDLFGDPAGRPRLLYTSFLIHFIDKHTRWKPSCLILQRNLLESKPQPHTHPSTTLKCIFLYREHLQLLVRRALIATRVAVGVQVHIAAKYFLDPLPIQVYFDT